MTGAVQFSILIFICTLVSISCLVLSVYSDTITLKTGGIVNGLITQEKSNEVIVKTGIGSIVIKKDQILSIDRDPDYFRKLVEIKKENADNLYNQAKEEYNSIKTLNRSFLYLNKYNKVIEECNKIVQKFPGFTASFKAQSLIIECYEQQGRYKKKSQAQDTYIKMLELHFGNNRAAEALREIADKEFDKDRDSYAQKHYDTLIEKYPEHISIIKLADKCFRAKKYDLARYYYQKDIKEDSNNSNIPYAYFKYAESYVREGNDNKAVAEYNKLISKYPENKWSEEAYYQIANCYFLHEKSEEAIAVLKDMIKKYPESSLVSDAKYLIGMAYYNQKQNSLAKQEFQDILKNYPDHPQRKLIEKIMQKL